MKPGELRMNHVQLTPWG